MKEKWELAETPTPRPRPDKGAGSGRCDAAEQESISKRMAKIGAKIMDTMCLIKKK